MSISQPATVPSVVADPANETLADKLNTIRGLRVSRYRSRPLGELVFEVSVDECDVEAELAVCRAELEVHQQFPEARIQLYVV